VGAHDGEELRRAEGGARDIRENKHRR